LTLPLSTSSLLFCHTLSSSLYTLSLHDALPIYDVLFDPTTWPKKARGVGMMEAPRGALAHWLTIEEGRIGNYQAVVPSTWNAGPDRKSTRLNSSHLVISYAVFCLKKKKDGPRKI